MAAMILRLILHSQNILVYQVLWHDNEMMITLAARNQVQISRWTPVVKKKETKKQRN